MQDRCEHEKKVKTDGVIKRPKRELRQDEGKKNKKRDRRPPRGGVREEV